MTPIKLKEIEFSTDTEPKISETVWNAEWFLRAIKKDVKAMRKNNWIIPDELGNIYEVFFTYGYTFERIYTDEDGFLNLTSQKKEN